MKVNIHTSLIIIISLIIINCKSHQQEEFIPKVVYHSDHLIITHISEKSYLHTSFKQTNDFGKVPCNGLIVSDSGEAIIFDTPTTDKSSDELIMWIKDTLQYQIKGVIPTHFHDDCLGGLKAFDDHQIPSYAYFRTIELAQENNFVSPQNSFTDSLILEVGNEIVIAKYFGEGHTKDNIVGYFPSENVLFGGCLIKEIDASKGYLGDSNIADWSATVEKIRKQYPDIKFVIPGHGNYGDKKLLDYTIELFKTEYQDIIL